MGWTVQGSNPSGGEIFHAVQTSPKAHPDFSAKGTRSFLGEQQLHMELTTHLLLPLGCEWVGVIPPSHLCASMSWDDLYFFMIMNIIERIDNMYI
jgi:hypothetical protein